MTPRPRDARPLTRKEVVTMWLIFAAFALTVSGVLRWIMGPT